jgi:Zn-dependent protease with chaperone function
MGDIFSLSSLSATLPTLLIETKYSQVFETEADYFALYYLKNKKYFNQLHGSILIV